MLDLAVVLAPASLIQSEVELLDIFVLSHLRGRSIEHDAPILHDVGVICQLKRGARVLLDDQHRHAFLPINLADDVEDFMHQQRRQTQ